MMARKNLLATILILAALGASAPATHAADPRPAPRPEIAGGWHAAPVDEAGWSAAKLAVLSLRRPNLKLVSVDSMEIQVVAGMNYRLGLTLSDHSHWEAVVWRSLRGTVEVTSMRPLQRRR